LSKCKHCCIQLAAKKEIQKQLNAAMFTFAQIPSLFFDHPGSNPYQSLHLLFNRTVQIQDIKSIGWHGVAMAGISMVGTAASFGRMMGTIDPDDEISQALNCSAMAVHTIECTLLGISLMKNYLNASTSSPRSPAKV
jgi:hypothetical protein